MTIAYVPILKGKEGEYAALEELDWVVRHRIAPLIEIPPVPFDYVNEQPTKSLEAHVRGTARRLRKCWGTDQPIFIDFSAHAEQDTLDDGQNALRVILEEAEIEGLKAIPVVYPGSAPATVQAAADAAHRIGEGVCIRMLVQDFDEELDVDERVSRVLEALGVSEANTDVVIDLGEISDDVQRSVLLVRALLAALPTPDRWRRVILSASSFPEDLREVDAATVSTMPRGEWKLWIALTRRPERLPKVNLIFSDYGITHPTLRELDPRTMRMSASIRYTGDEDWVIVKGRNVRQYGFDQYFGLCETLVKHPAYKGPAFSWGDKFIADTAARSAGPGNATTWRKVGTNHHLTLVAIQLATIAVP